MWMREPGLETGLLDWPSSTFPDKQDPGASSSFSSRPGQVSLA